VELLAPAGNFEKLEIAIHYGADAVYLAGKQFSLRNFSDNFTLDELSRAIELAHAHHVKVYVACNSFVRNTDIPGIIDLLLAIGKAMPDGIIIADPGVLKLALEHAPNIPLHLSTQANTTNIQSTLFWKSLGIKRINVARELPLSDIRQISKESGLEIEAFVHGAMCIAYSGRCLLSNYLTGRDANQGMCTHPCRWRYTVMEETRPDVHLPLMEDDNGSYVFSSKDLCMIDHIPEMIQSGISSLKIEGRMKSIHYLATTIKAYREALDAFYLDPEKYSVKEDWWRRELALINHRGYCTGFYFGDPHQVAPNYAKSHTFEGHLFLGKIETSEKDGLHEVNVRNKLESGSPVEVLTHQGPAIQDRIIELLNQQGESMRFAHPGTRAGVRLEKQYAPNDIIRKTRNYS
jgi:putative protease